MNRPAGDGDVEPGCTAVHADHHQRCALGDHRGTAHQITIATPTGPVPVWWVDTLARRTSR